MAREVILKNRDGHKFNCEVDSSAEASTIVLTNTATNELWTCTVTSASMDTYCIPEKDLRLGNLHGVVMAILQSVWHGTLKGPNVWGALKLAPQHSPYYMTLQLDCHFDGKSGGWTFHMIPEDPAAIQKREAEATADTKK